MPKAIGPRKIGKYPLEFKAKAVALSHLPGLEVRQVAEALGIHPFMLSRWRKEARAGLFMVSGKIGLDAKPVAELKRLHKKASMTIFGDKPTTSSDNTRL